MVCVIAVAAIFDVGSHGAKGHMVHLLFVDFFGDRYVSNLALVVDRLCNLHNMYFCIRCARYTSIEWGKLYLLSEIGALVIVSGFRYNIWVGMLSLSENVYLR